MVNNKKGSTSRRTTTSSTGVKKKTTASASKAKRPVRRVVDPMMVSPIRAKRDDSKLTTTAIENDVDFTEEEDDTLGIIGIVNWDDSGDAKGQQKEQLVKQ